jgi:uncharacterized protein YbjT (DUF2867 family)
MPSHWKDKVGVRELDYFNEESMVRAFKGILKSGTCSLIACSVICDPRCPVAPVSKTVITIVSFPDKMPSHWKDKVGVRELDYFNEESMVRAFKGIDNVSQY